MTRQEYWWGQHLKCRRKGKFPFDVTCLPRPGDIVREENQHIINNVVNVSRIESLTFTTPLIHPHPWDINWRSSTSASFLKVPLGVCFILLHLLALSHSYPESFTVSKPFIRLL
jgi:hypothetical protein